jgi:hypothetical protein
MITIDEAEVMLNEIAAELPPEFFRELNGGILLLPEQKLHSKHIQSDLFTLGEYHDERGLGKYIIIYYGSMLRVFGHLSPARFKEELKETLLHEFTHHLESLAGERGLEIKDEIEMEKYRRLRRRMRE